MKTLLIIAHAPSPNTQILCETLRRTARTYGELPIAFYSPFEVNADQLCGAAGVIFFTPENFGYMSGALKDMFDRTYNDVVEKLQGMPYFLIVRAGHDGTGCQRAVSSILKGLRWRPAQPDLILQGRFREQFHSSIAESAGAFAASLVIT